MSKLAHVSLVELWFRYQTFIRFTCAMSNRNQLETRDHLFFYHPFARLCWSYLWPSWNLCTKEYKPKWTRSSSSLDCRLLYGNHSSGFLGNLDHKKWLDLKTNHAQHLCLQAEIQNRAPVASAQGQEKRVPWPRELGSGFCIVLPRCIHIFMYLCMYGFDSFFLVFFS